MGELIWLPVTAGATLGPGWLDLVRVRHPLARGLAHGVALPVVF
ncbi:MAG: hypothetical protein ABWZ67_17165 [Solirubrobacteraceae bacterium]